MPSDLSKFNNSWYKPGSAFKRGLWYFFNVTVMLNPMNPFSGIKKFFLRMFGAKIGKKVLIKPCVNVKYPWFLEIGDHSWIGEGVWIDNLGKVKIGSNVCISQGGLLLCGNHNYKKTEFDLMVGDITLEDGVWIGAKSIVTGNVICKTHSILTSGSVANNTLEPHTIYQGNPAVVLRERKMEQ